MRKLKNVKLRWKYIYKKKISYPNNEINKKNEGKIKSI